MERQASKIALIVIIVIFVLPLLIFGYIVVSWNGGVANTIRRLTPRPNVEQASIKAEREKLDAGISARLDAIAAANGFKVYGSAEDDRCYDGENNWKRTDGYAHRCSLRLTRLFGFDSDFRQTMLDFENSLLNSGWTAGTSNMNTMMVEYYDRRKAPLHHVPSPGSYKMPGLTLAIEWDEGAGTPRQQPDDNQPVREAFHAFWDKDSRIRRYRLDSNQRIRAGSQDFYERSDTMDTPQAFNNATRSVRYVLSVSIYGHYFEN